MTLDTFARYLQEHELEFRVLQAGHGWRACLLKPSHGFFFPILWEAQNADPFVSITTVIAKHRSDAAGQVMA